MPHRRSWAAIVVGLIVALIGLVLAVGGAWLAAIGGSPYYVITGIAMIVSGVLMIRGRMSGAWLYVAIVVATILWAFWEVSYNAWALVPRIVAPIVLLVAVILIMPTLTARPRRWAIALGSIAAVVVATGVLFTVAGRDRNIALPLPAPGAAMSDPSGQATGADWPAYGGTYAARRYSPLTQINASNVGRLEKVWETHTGGTPTDPAYAKLYGTENTPIKVGNLLYTCTAKNVIVALDPATGKQAWRYDPRVPDEWIPYTTACRGVDYYAVPGAAPGSECAARIIMGTLDSRLIAVDALTGRPCSGFGTNGQTDTKIGMGDVYPGLASINSAPTIVRGVVVVGHQILDGQTRLAPSGVIQGFDAVTGRLRWAWDMMHPEWTGYPPAGQTWARGTPNMWTSTSGDEQLGLVYLPMGNAAVDYWSSKRTPQENAYATSLVALDVTTGKPRWRFQAVKHDVWDYDFGSQATLIDYKGTPAIVVPSKQGDLYILDRATGRSLAPLAEMTVPQGGVEPEQRAKTQLFSKWHTLRKEPLTERDMWGMSPIDQMVCRIQYRRADYRGFFTPPRADRYTVEYPGYNGGSDWGGVSIDPTRGVIVANYNDMPNYVRLVPRAEADKLGIVPRYAMKSKAQLANAHSIDPQWDSPYAVKVNAGWRVKFTGLLCKQPPYGGIRAIDIATGRILWDRPFGTARKNGPFGIASGMPFHIGTPNNGGSVVTAGGLVFIAAATDDLIRAIDIATGKTLWSAPLPAGGQATPAVYEQNGREYLVIFAGGHHFMETKPGDSVIAYALPQTR
ncbi:membrane-bound PQQ-dependent dehydrogenase, glucose/quinate/shikimate family [Sphingomonas cannabina]|uniref:membrane-bound PQQ-dependent dehydrogenase, glucose/quinate/shikimate family n=1 Tax=Sphingomonas cannabina TaxID=2899123 RepID=UPI001F2D3F63|nr:membrane-bound PQQ-dependent dehydrogenase, glucose/quinate/shikimate family [Sphingomonas cannabina]UIJ44230.1 membrane-bound PQQ-dependent dehydrogenase, glucose/quinate/shikimate family [Sphingomonas cannabina]